MTDGERSRGGERRVNDAGIQVVWARGFRFPVYGDSGRRSAPGGGAGGRRASGRPVGLGGGLRDGVRGARAGAGRVRLGLLGGADLRSLRGVCVRSGRGQHGGGLGRSVCHRLCRAAVGAVRVPFARRRFGLHRSGVGLQRPGGRGGAEPGLGGAAPDPAGPCGRGFRPRRCGRPVRSAVRVRRYGGGSRHAVGGRQAIWTVRRPKRYGLPVRPVRR